MADTTFRYGRGTYSPGNIPALDTWQGALGLNPDDSFVSQAMGRMPAMADKRRVPAASSQTPTWPGPDYPTPDNSPGGNPFPGGREINILGHKYYAPAPSDALTGYQKYSGDLTTPAAYDAALQAAAAAMRTQRNEYHPPIHTIRGSREGVARFYTPDTKEEAAGRQRARDDYLQLLDPSTRQMNLAWKPNPTEAEKQLENYFRTAEIAVKTGNPEVAGRALNTITAILRGVTGGKDIADSLPEELPPGIITRIGKAAGVGSVTDQNYEPTVEELTKAYSSGAVSHADLGTFSRVTGIFPKEYTRKDTWWNADDAADIAYYNAEITRLAKMRDAAIREGDLPRQIEAQKGIDALKAGKRAPKKPEAPAAKAKKSAAPTKAEEPVVPTPMPASPAHRSESYMNRKADDFLIDTLQGLFKQGGQHTRQSPLDRR